MDQLYPIPGPTTSSCASQDFDFLNYWTDQSVEKEIQRGKQLRELKQRPTLRKQKYDVINIGHTNIYSEKKHKRRSRSPYKSRKNTRRNSPKGKKSPVRKFTKKDSKSARPQRCPMRIAELSVPSKRQCIDTWRNKNHVLPGIMIDRLREHVMDLRPVVKIPDAIECFKIHKNAERKKKKETKQRKIKMDIKESKMKVKSIKVQQSRYLATIFGHKITKELNKPVQITLNSELQKISNSVSAEIDKLINKDKGITNTNVKNRRVQAEVAGKITIWISNILEESAYKILEDQLKDLEEEVGPVLDMIDDLVDNVVNICEPEPTEVSSSSDISYIEYESQEEAKEEATMEENENGEVESRSVNLSVDVDNLPEPEFSAEVVENLDDYIKMELDKIIDLFDQDNIYLDLYIDNIAVEDDKFTDSEDQLKFAIENQTDKEQNEFVDANDTLEVPLDVPETQVKLDDFKDNSQVDQAFHHTGSIELDKRQVPLDVPETQVKLDDFKDNSQVDQAFHHTGSIELDKRQEEEADQGTLITDHEGDSVTDLVSPDESNKKVKFSDINMVTIDEAKEQGAVITPEYVNTDQFSTPNDRLLSDADESWPEDISLPLIRPSESASKSVTSLGKIMEEDERTSTMLDIDITKKDMAPIKYDISDNKIAKDDIVDSSKQTKAAQIEAVYDTTDLSSRKRLEQLEPATDEAKDDRIKSFTENEPAQIQSQPTDETEYNIFHSEQKEQDKAEHDIIDPEQKEQDKAEYDIIDPEQTDQNKAEYDIIDPEQKEQNQFKLPTESAKDEKVDSKQTRSPQLASSGHSYEQRETEFSNQYVIDENGTIYTDFETHRPSTDSTFPCDVPTKLAEYEHKLSIITEHEFIDDNIKEDALREIEKVLSEISYTREGQIKTAEVGTNTSYTLILRAEKSTSVQSQSLGDIAKYLDIKKPDLFSSLRIKSNDYKVDKKSAPTWVSRNYEEPYISSSATHRKVPSDMNIRLWCKDLENGFDNLELWNGWIEKTVQTVKITEMKRARICLDKSREQFVRDWLHLKKNVDADVLTWSKLSKCTQEKMKAFRKIYPNVEMSTSGPKQSNSCNCHR